MSREDELREILNQAAKEIARTQANPRTWQSWVVYLLGRLEDEAITGNPGYNESFRDTLSSLQDAIRNRLRTGGW
jgi:hypothetical protein